MLDHSLTNTCFARKRDARSRGVVHWRDGRILPVASMALPLPRAAARDANNVEQIVFFATHELDSTDTRLFRRYSHQLRAALPASLWVALYQSDREHMEIDPVASAAVEGGVWAWGDASLRRSMPNLAAAIDRHAGLAAERDVYLQRYYWFTASLALWNESVGAHFPRMRYWWRVEPDVAFSGSWGSLLLRLAQPQGDEADVLLPRVISYHTDPGFPHYYKNLDVLKDLPRSAWCKSLVAIARYSMRFMAHMTTLWLRGTLGYEEVFLPTQCVLLGNDACHLKSLHNVTRRSALRAFPASDQDAPPIGRPEVFRYRPEVACDDVARATARNTRELWHPLKRRECLLDVEAG